MSVEHWSNEKEKREFELKKLEFEKALELRNFEIDNFWKRGWFFGALLIALVGAYFIAIKANLPNWGLCIAFIAFLVSLLQGFINRGSKYWQERWEYVTKNKEAALGINLTRARNTKLKFVENSEENYFERGIIDVCIRAKDERFLTRSARWSVSKLTFLIWDLLTISCFCIWFREFLIATVNIEEISYIKGLELIIFHLLIIGYVIFFMNINGKIHESLTKPETYLKENPQNKSKYHSLSESYVNDEHLEKTVEHFRNSK